MWYSYLQDFFTQHAYPEDGSKALLDVISNISADSTLWNTLCSNVDAYEKGEIKEDRDARNILKTIRTDAEAEGIHTESAELLFFLMCTKHLKTLYADAGLPMDYYDGVASDLLSKLWECYRVKGIWGSFVASWFIGFFAMTRFVIGRLQYELIKIPEITSPDGKYHFHDTTAVNIHIPSGRPLLVEDVRASMAQAAKFFAPHFPGEPVLFHCCSWLLFPGHREMLPADSGICRFMDEFTLINSSIYEVNSNLWRIFNTMETDDLDKLPLDTSLQRQYVQWLRAGKPTGNGTGIRYISP